MAGEYFLLRNNKKSGPFNAAQLIALPLKPYDLIWIEGKSAAWRYAGEVPELKDFAPQTEEQPFDRFYKKASTLEKATTNGEETGQSLSNRKIGTSVETPFLPETPVKADGAPAQAKKGRKVKVIVPVNGKATASGANIVLPDKTMAADAVKDNREPIEDSGILHLKQETVVEKEIDAKKQSKAVNQSDEPVLETKYTGSLDEIKRDYHDWVKSRNGRRTTSLPVTKAWIFPVAGVVLVTLGIFIGLKMNNSALQEQREQVAKIEGKEKRQVTAEIPAPSEQNKDQIENSMGPAVNPTTTSEENAEKTISRTSLKRKENTAKNILISKPVVSTAAKKKMIKDASIDHPAASSRQDEYLEKPVAQNASHRSLPQKNALTRIEDIVGISGNYEPAGKSKGILTVKLTAVNRSDEALKMIALDLRYFNARNEVVKEERLYFKNLPANGTRQIIAPGSNLATRVGYRVMLVSTVEGELYYASN